MNKQQVINKYPRLFPKGEPDCGFYIGEAWIPLVDKLCQKIVDILGPDDTCIVDQVKEKFGGLRFYYHSNKYDEINLFVRECEDACELICSECGKEHKKTTDNGWISSRCSDCKNKQ